MAVLGSINESVEGGFGKSLTVLNGLKERAKSDSGLQKKLASDMARLNPELRNPLLSSINFYIPVERSILNQWIRYYYRFHPLVGNAIDFHTEMPMSRFGFKGIKDPSILRFYEEMSEEMDLYNFLVDLLREYFLLGEAVPYLYWDKDFNCWTDAELINPDFINVRGHPLLMGGGSLSKGYNSKYIIELIPDQTLRDFAGSTNPEDIELKNDMDPALLGALRTGNNIRLDSFNVSMIARKQHRYEPRGTSIILRILKDLMYEDKLRESQYSIAEGHITPKQIWKLGDANHIPTDDDLRSFRDMLIDANNDPIFSIITHYAVNADFVGSAGKIMPLVPEFEFVYNRILTGLFMNKSLAHGEGVSHQNASVALRALMSRYVQIRGMMEDWCFNKVFTPVAIANDFYETTQAELDHGVRKGKEDRKLIVPKIDWRSKTNLLDDNQIKNFLISLRGRMGLPMKVICEALELDYDYVATWLKAEEGSVFDPAYQEIRSTEYKTRMTQRNTPDLKKSDETGRNSDQSFIDKGEPRDIGGGEEPIEIGTSLKKENASVENSGKLEKMTMDRNNKRIEEIKKKMENLDDGMDKVSSIISKASVKSATMFSVLENKNNPLEIKVEKEEELKDEKQQS